MAHLVQITDHVRGGQTSLPFTASEAEDLVGQWHDPDPLLGQLQTHEAFRGRVSPADLDLTGLRVLVALHLSLDADLPARHSGNRVHPIVRSLHRLLLALIHRLEIGLGGSIPYLAIVRRSPTLVDYTLTAALDPIAFPPVQASPSFRIVVDNSRKAP